MPPNRGLLLPFPHLGESSPVRRGTEGAPGRGMGVDDPDDLEPQQLPLA